MKEHRHVVKKRQDPHTLGDSNIGNDLTLVHADDGDLDLTFDGDGIALSPVFTRDGDALGQSLAIQASATQADQKVVMAGYSEKPSGSYEFAVVRYHSDGSLDASFGDDGVLTVAPGGNSDFATAVAIQSDGQIVVPATARVLARTSKRISASFA